MRRLLWTNVRGHPLRVLLTGVAVMIGSAFLVATLLLSDTVRGSVDSLGGSAVSDVVLVRGQLPFEASGAAGSSLAGLASRPPVDASLLGTVRQVDGVAAAATVSEGPALLRQVQVTGPFGGRTDAAATATTWIEDSDLSGERLSQGRAPATDTEVAVNTTTATAYSVHLGDRVQVAFPAATLTVEVVGVTEPTTGTGVLDLGPTLDVAPGAASSLLGLPAGKVSQIRAQAAAGVSQAELISRLQSALRGQQVDVAPGDELVKAIRDLLRQLLDVATNFLLVFAGIALFVGGFIIFNTFSIILAQRTRETALLRAIGASRGQVLGAMLGEAALVGLAASAVGLAVGVGLFVVVKLAAAALAGATLDLVLRPRLLVVLVLGTLITSVAGVVPSLRAASIAPLEAMREAAVDRSPHRLRRGLVGMVELVGGMVLLWLGSSGHGIGWLAVGLASTFVAVTTLGPFLAPPVAGLVGGPLTAWRGVTGRLARDNARRNPRRTSATAAALIIGVTLVVTIAVFGSSLQATTAHRLESAYRADILVDSRSALGIPTTAVDAVAATPGVRLSVPVRLTQAGLGGEVVTVTGIDPASVASVVDVQVVDGSLAAVDDGAIALSRSTAERLGATVGATVPVELPNGQVELRVAAIYHVDSGVLGDAVVSPGRFAAGVPSTGQAVRQVLVTVAPGATVSEVQGAVDAALSDVGGVDVTTPSAQADQLGAIITVVLAVVYGLLGLSVVIAAVGIANSLALSVFERRHEIALLRAVGMTRSQARSSVRWEAVLVSLYGTATGIVLGVVFGIVIVRAQADFTVSFSLLTWLTLVSAGVVGVGVGVLAAVVPAWRASRGEIVQALTAE